MEISILKNKTLKNITVAKDSNDDTYDREESILFETTEGKKYQMFHSQDCCEEVYIEDICGDLNDLMGEPLLIAEERSNKDTINSEKEVAAESFTWTFYEFATIKGSVTIRWFGKSNGYYSEEVSFGQLNTEND
jgi:hypothetical protein